MDKSKLSEPFNHIPEQYIGTASDTTAHRKFKTTEEAVNAFNESCNRLLDVNSWEKLGAGLPGSGYDLINTRGNKVHGSGEKGLFIRIQLPAPKGHTGDGYDWVEIEDVYKESQSDEDLLHLQVSPSKNPDKPEDGTAHFFDGEASKSFIVYRKGKELYLIVSGRNQQVNDHPLNLWDRVRNFIVGLPAMLGLSAPHWKIFAEAIIKDTK